MQDQASLSAGLTRLPEKWILKERAFPLLANASRMHFQFLASVEIQKRNDGNKDCYLNAEHNPEFLWFMPLKNWNATAANTNIAMDA